MNKYDDDDAPPSRRVYRCFDGFCGADDCTRCRPWASPDTEENDDADDDE